MPENEKDGIKGPISQYNYFSMESRKQVREASGAVEVSHASLTVSYLTLVTILSVCQCRCRTTSGTGWWASAGAS